MLAEGVTSPVLASIDNPAGDDVKAPPDHPEITGISATSVTTNTVLEYLIDVESNNGKQTTVFPSSIGSPLPLGSGSVPVTDSSFSYPSVVPSLGPLFVADK